MGMKQKMAVMSDKENKAQQAKTSQPKKPSSSLSQKQIIGIALLIVGVILIGIAILTW